MVSKKPLAWRRREASARANQVSAAIRWRLSSVINGKWSAGVALINSGFDAHGAASDAIARAAGFREPPEPEPSVQEPPRKPLAPEGGAQP